MLARETIGRLMGEPGGPCISLYMPANGAKDALHQNPIRLKNLLRVAEVHLLGQGMREAEARKLLEPAWRLVKERPYWQSQHGGVALFIAPGLFHQIQAPLAFPEHATVAGTFYLKPLFPLLNADREFYILSLSQKNVRLLHSTPFAVEEVPLPDLADTMAEALGYDVHRRQVLVRTGTPRGAGQRGQVYYGMGSEERDEKAELLQFSRLVDGALREHLKEKRVPLVLAAVASVGPIYREANTFPYLLDETLTGHPDELTPAQLQARALDVVQPYFDRTRQTRTAQYRELDGTGRTAADLREILPAAHHGRVEALFVEEASHIWGRYTPGTGQLEVHEAQEPGDQDLLEMAVLSAYAAGGTVFVVSSGQMPVARAAAAILRY
jgi:hypothetical protein